MLWMTSSALAVLTLAHAPQEGASIQAPPQDAPWIVRAQTEAGSWDGDASVGALGTTALVVLGFVGDGHGRAGGSFQAAVTRAADWIVGRQDAASGCFGGAERATLRADEAPLLEHAWATLAVSELLISNAGWHAGAEARSRAVAALLAAQRDDGSFGTARATGWAAYALVSALESGAEVSAQALWDARQALARKVEVEGDAAHLDAGKVALRSLIGIMVRTPEGVAAPDEAALAALARVVDVPDLWPALDPEARMLVTFAAYQRGGETWKSATRGLKACVVAPAQAARASLDGFPAARGFGRARATAFGALVLEAYFRYARVLGMR